MCLLNPGLQISTNLGYMEKLLEVLHQGLALLTPRWDQFGGITRRLERQKVEPEDKNERAEDHLEIVSFPENEPSHTDQLVEPVEQGPISTLRRSMRQRRPPPRFKDFVMD